MSKFTTIARPAALIISMVAAFGAHAQTASDDADRAGYGASYPVAAAKAPSRSASQEIVVTAARTARVATEFDAADRSGYGPTPATPSLRTRAEVRAEAIAAIESGFQAQYLEGADPQYVVFIRPYKKPVDSTHAAVSSAVKAAQ